MVNFRCQLGWAVVPSCLIKYQYGCCDVWSFRWDSPSNPRPLGRHMTCITWVGHTQSLKEKIDFTQWKGNTFSKFQTWNHNLNSLLCLQTVMQMEISNQTDSSVVNVVCRMVARMQMKTSERCGILLRLSAMQMCCMPSPRHVSNELNLKVQGDSDEVLDSCCCVPRIGRLTGRSASPSTAFLLQGGLLCPKICCFFKCAHTKP